MRSSTAPLGQELTQPLALTAVGVLALNDHVLKGAGLLPAWLTGKLSDVAGLAFFPLLLFVAADACLWLFGLRSHTARRALAIASPVATALGFSLVKLHPAVNAAVGAVWGPMLLDVTDLVALPATLVARALLRRSTRRDIDPSSPPPKGLRAAAVLFAAAASIATPAPQMRRNYPAWELATQTSRVGCAELTAWVSKSGKQGLGITLELVSIEHGCRVEFDAAEIDVGGQRVAALSLPPALSLEAPQRVYLPFAFDNEAAWNDGRREGQFRLALRARGAPERFRTRMTHLRLSPHVRVEREPHPLSPEGIRGGPRSAPSASPGLPQSPLVPEPSPPPPEFSQPPPEDAP